MCSEGAGDAAILETKDRVDGRCVALRSFTFKTLALREVVVVHVVQEARAEAAHETLDVAVLDVERRDSSGSEHHAVLRFASFQLGASLG